MCQTLRHNVGTVMSTTVFTTSSSRYYVERAELFYEEDNTMFQFKGDRLYPDVLARTFSFQIPESFWNNTFPEENSQDHISFYTAEVEVSVNNS